jgi:hypothetical protein
VEAKEGNKENRHVYVLKIKLIEEVIGNILTYYMRIWSVKCTGTNRTRKMTLQEWGRNDCSRNI